MLPILSGLIAVPLTIGSIAAHAQTRPLEPGIRYDRSGVYADFQHGGPVIGARMAAQDLGKAVAGPIQDFSPRKCGPNEMQSGVYASVLHDSKADDACDGGADEVKVVTKLKEWQAVDPLFGRGEIRPDGRKCHPVHLFEVRHPIGSDHERDDLKLGDVIPADQAFGRRNDDGCPHFPSLQRKRSA